MSQKEIKKINKNNMSLFNISKLICNNSYKEHQCFLYHVNLETFCIIIDEEEKYENISNKSFINIFKYAQDLKIKTIFLFLNKNNKDIFKIKQTIMIMGFEKENIINSALLDDGNIYLLFKICFDKKKKENVDVDDIEDIEF
jgi:hypothetical protein